MPLVQSIEKPYYYVFYVIAKFYVQEWAAVLVMTVFQSILILGLVCGVALDTGHTPLLIPKLTLVVETLVVYAITQNVLVGKRHRDKAEVDLYSRAKSKMASVAVWCGFVLATYGGISLIKA